MAATAEAGDRDETRDLQALARKPITGQDTNKKTRGRGALLHKKATGGNGGKNAGHTSSTTTSTSTTASPSRRMAPTPQPTGRQAKRRLSRDARNSRAWGITSPPS